MSFSEFWEMAVEQNPALANERMLFLDVEKFRQALKDAFDAGDDAGYERGLRAAEVNAASEALARVGDGSLEIGVGRRH